MLLTAKGQGQHQDEVDKQELEVTKVRLNLQGRKWVT